jgi:hypothetical protein
MGRDGEVGLELTYDIETTSHPRCAAALQIRLPGCVVSYMHTRTSHLSSISEQLGDQQNSSSSNSPKNPLPPHTTSFFFAA